MKFLIEKRFFSKDLIEFLSLFEEIPLYGLVFSQSKNIFNQYKSDKASEKTFKTSKYLRSKSSSKTSKRDSISIPVADNTAIYIGQENKNRIRLSVKTLSIDNSLAKMDSFMKDSTVNPPTSIFHKESNLITSNIIENYTNNVSNPGVDDLDFRVEIPKTSIQGINKQKTVTFFNIYYGVINELVL